MKFEDVLEEVGSFGIYQKLLCFTVIPVTTGIVGFTYYVQIFMLSAPDFVCNQSMFEQNRLDVVNNVFNISRDWNDSDIFKREELVCHQLSSGQNGSYAEDDVSTSGTSDLLEPCSNGFTYDYETLFPTVTSQNDWVCGDSWKPYLIMTFFWIGNMIGAWFFGTLSDVYGRRPVIASTLLVYGCAGVASAFVTKYFYWFLIFRFLVGTAYITLSHLSFVLVMEFCGIRSRVVPLLTTMISYTMASILTPLLALFLWNWKNLALATSIPPLVVLVFYKWLPESSSWMMTRGKMLPAAKQLETVSRINKRWKSREEITQYFTLINFKQENEDNEKPCRDDSSLLNLLKFPRLRINVLAVLLIWLISCMAYYGHCQNTGNIGSNIFTNYLLASAAEIPSWGALFLIQKIGRKPTLIAAFILSGVSGIIYAALPLRFEKVMLSFALLARMFITVTYYISLQYGPEIFPTIVRGRGVALSESLGGVGIFLSPLIVYLGEFHSTYPMVIFSCLSLIGGALTLVLPETKGRALPQTMAQAESFAQTEKSCGCFSTRGRKHEINVRQPK